MNIFRQLLIRKKAFSVLLIILIASSVIFSCIGCCAYFNAKNQIANISSSYTTIAVPNPLIRSEFSLVTRFKLSVRLCSFLNFGSATATQTPTKLSSTTTATPVEAVHCQFFVEILHSAHTAIIGALSKTSKPITISICTCVISFVERVIKLAVEKLLRRNIG